jgi:hypothetical protein
MKEIPHRPAMFVDPTLREKLFVEYKRIAGLKSEGAKLAALDRLVAKSIKKTVPVVRLCKKNSGAAG